MRTLPAALLLAVCAGEAVAQARPVPATCSRDLFQLDGEMRRQLRALEGVGGADQGAQCRAWRGHVAFLQKARGLFATCQSGLDRDENVAQMDGSLADFRVLLAQRCRGL